MKISKIIKKLNIENEEDVKFEYNYDELSKRLGFLNQHKQKSQLRRHPVYYSIFKYAFLVLFIISITLNCFSLYKLNKYKQLIKESTGEDIIFEYFEKNNLDYIASPIKTEIVNEHLLRVYLGITKSNKAVFIYAFSNLSEGVKIQVLTQGHLEGIPGTIFKFDKEADELVVIEVNLEYEYDVKIKFNDNGVATAHTMLLDVEKFIKYLKNG